jgi:competence protein ComGC
MKTTIESYQNLTKQDLEWNIKDCEAIMKHCKQIGDMETYHIQLKARRNNIQELKRRNEVTPTTTQNKSNIERIKTQINQTIKKRTRNNITFEYALFLHTVRKISTKKFLLIANKKRVKTDTLRRVHTLLVYEHNRLNKVA